MEWSTSDQRVTGLVPALLSHVSVSLGETLEPTLLLMVEVGASVMLRSHWAGKSISG